MKIILKHILKNISEKKGRSILIVFSLVIASLVFILNLTIPNQIIEANKNKIRNLVGKSDVVILSYDNFSIDDIKLNDEKINSVGVNQLFFIHKDKTVALYGTNILDASKQQLIDVNSLNDNEIIISKATAEKFEYKVNDIITINVNDKDYELKIVNILESKGLLYLKTYSGIVNDNTFNKIQNMEDNKYSSYYIDVVDDANIDSFTEKLKQDNKEYIIQKLVDEDAIKEDNAYVSVILIIIFVMSTIMIFFVVNTLNKMIMLERLPVIATFRSVGATKYRMNFILVLENATYGLIGGVIGAISSLLINNLSVKLLLGGESLNTTVPFINIVAGILFAIMLEVLMSIGAIIKSNKYSIKEIMFDGKGAKFKFSKRSSILSILTITGSILLNIFTNDNNFLIDLLSISMFWFGVATSIPLIMLGLSKIVCFFAKKIGNGSLIIAGKNLGSNKMLISSSRLVVISISIMLVIFNVSSRFDKMLNSFSYQFQGYNLFIRDTSKEYTEYDKLSNIKEIDKIGFVFLHEEHSTFNGKSFDVDPIILGMKESRPDIEEYNYKIEDLKEDEILIDSVYANNNNLKIGDTIKLKIDSFEQEFEFKIMGTVNSFYQSVERQIIILNEKFFTDNISKVPFQIVIGTKDDSELKSTISKLEHELKDPDITIMTVDEFVEQQRNNIHTIMYLFYIIIGLAVILSFVGIINNQIISFMERTKELAVLNSICMSRSQLKRMLLIENVTSTFASCIVGFVVSIISVILMNSVLNGMKMYIDVHFDSLLALMLIGIVLVILVMTVIIPIRKLKKINIIESIKYE